MSAPRGLFVTGTDTGVGKTLVAAGLLRLARRRGLTPIPFKPVETGCDPEPADARRLWRAAVPPIDMGTLGGSPNPPAMGRAGQSPAGPHAIALDDVCMHAFPLPAAPALAAQAAGRRIDVAALAGRAHALAERGDFLLVEGAGGLLVPYGDGQTTADLAALIGLPLLVVGRMALGTINHVALTLAEAARRNLTVAACILNRTDADVGPHESGNLEMIAAVTGRRPLGVVAHLPAEARDDDDRVADAIETAIGDQGLRLLLG
jgi:dethiobiotin synthetase